MSIARLFACNARLAAFFLSREVSVATNKRRLLAGEWDAMRNILGVLRSAFEVSIRTESADEPLATMVALLSSLRRVIHAQSFSAPCLPGPCLAAGNDAIERFCEENPDDAVIEVDNHRYPAETLHVEEQPGKERLGTEAATVVGVLRDQLDLRFFNSSDESRNILASPAVLMSCSLSPGGARLLRSLARQLGVRDPGDDAVSHVRSAFSKLCEPSTPASGPPSAQAPSRARERARSSLVELSDDDDESDPSQRLPRSALALSELEAYMRVTDGTKKTCPLTFWKQHKTKHPCISLFTFSVLGAVASAAGSERNFSLAGSIIHKKRTALLSQHLEMHCFIHDNFKLLPKDLNDIPILSRERVDL